MLVYITFLTNEWGQIMTNYIQNKVSATVWPWVNPNAALANGEHSLKSTLIGLVVGSLAGTWFFFKHHQTLAYVVWSIAALIFISAICIKPLHKALMKFFGIIGFIVGKTLTWILLVPFFYICFPIGHFFNALFGKDPMTRKCPTDLPSYWVDRPAITDKEYYKRQS